MRTYEGNTRHPASLSELVQMLEKAQNEPLEKAQPLGHFLSETTKV